MLTLAPMYDVTDTTFRQVVSLCAPPDMYYTEFVNVDGLQSAGRDRLLHLIKLEKTDTPVIAQIWGKVPENYRATAKELAEMGFDGIDINTGCPEKNIVKNGCCSAFMKPENWESFAEVLQATKDGVKDSGIDIPVSVKTRLGFSEIDLGWHEFVLKQGVSILTVHGRTRKEMSKVPVHWDEIQKICAIRDRVAPGTKIVGNGDVLTRTDAEKIQKDYGVDGVMIGRGIFANPFLFAEDDTVWQRAPKEEKINLFITHLGLYRDTYPNRERKFDPMKKFMKVYLNGFEGASDLRDKIAHTNSCDEAIEVLEEHTC